MSMTSSLSTSGFSLGQHYVVRRFDPSMSRPPTLEEINQRNQEISKQKAQEAQKESQISAYNAVKAHTIIRVGGEIAAVIYRDGVSEYYKDESFIGLGAHQYADQLPGPQRRDYIVNAIMKKLGRTAVEERYGEVGWAPARGAIGKESNESKQ